MIEAMNKTFEPMKAAVLRLIVSRGVLYTRDPIVAKTLGAASQPMEPVVNNLA